MARQNFLDQLRLLMIVLVVYGHVEMTIGPLGAVKEDGSVPSLVVDDYTYSDSGTASSSLATRYIALARPWCIPLLFWISGAAASFGKVKPVIASVTPLFIMTVIGMALNAFTWFLGPADPACSPFTPCKGKGLLFDFSIVAFSGTIFPIVFQMWFTVYLLVFVAWCTPVFKAMDTANHILGYSHLLVSAVFYLPLGSYTPGGYRTSIYLLGYDAVFLFLAFLTTPAAKRPKILPMRLVHYAMAALLVAQVGCTQFMVDAETLSMGYTFFLLVAFKQFFLLGFVMMKSKSLAEKQTVGSNQQDVECMLLSRCWPVCLFLLLLVSPSTNYLRAGNFTWPYYARLWDRCLYITFALMVIFIIDRIGRVEHATIDSAKVLSCVEMNSRLVSVGSACYLLHPLCMTFILQYTSIKGVPSVWVACCIICAAVGALLNLDGLLSKLGKGGKGSPENPKSLRALGQGGQQTAMRPRSRSASRGPEPRGLASATVGPTERRPIGKK